MLSRSLLTALILACAARADVTLPSVLASHMVVQRGKPVHVWGTAQMGESVTVSFRGNTRTAVANDIGRWSVSLPSSEAGGPFELVVEGRNRIVLNDILVGDVWIASGQSNMEFTLKEAVNGAAEVAAANHPRMRLFHVKRVVADHPMDDVEASWVACTPEAAANFSAVAIFFARQLQAKLSVPVGLIDSSWGGTPAEAWISLASLSADAALMPVFSEWSRMNSVLSVTRPRRDKQLAEWRDAVARAKADGKPGPGFPWKANDSGEWAPASLFNAMIAPLTGFPIRGAIWYQGESNASKERAPLYKRLFETMIQDWRRAWQQEDLPFFFVQLANYKTGPDSRWPDLREAQRQTLELRNTGMAVTIDIGTPNGIHPPNKQDVGLRLALAARAIAYGEHIEYSGPAMERASFDGSAVRVSFKHTGKGLVAHGGSLTGFEIAGKDGVFKAAEARIEGNEVVLSNAAIAAPTLVRYAWSDNPQCNLFNADGLPASPFRGDLGER